MMPVIFAPSTFKMNKRADTALYLQQFSLHKTFTVNQF
ncbi:hypothetical protein B4125_1526 [Bacillus paralicheniformis]|nr:hypothetical protein B4125_1526 [Bacillus paralicheniformis]